MNDSLFGLVTEIEAPIGSTTDSRIHYSVREVPGSARYFVGMDARSNAALLVRTGTGGRSRAAPIRLARVDVRFDIPCHIEGQDVPLERRRFTVIRCLDSDRDTVEYFLSVCGAIVRMLGETPTSSQIRLAVHRLVAIFQKTHTPSATTINGLFGELYLISRSRSPRRLLTAWRSDPAARFDFVDGDARFEVKTTSRRIRSHVFSYEQCNPPKGTVAVVASMRIERVARGVTLKRIVEEIGDRVGSETDLLLKLHEVVAATLGEGLGGAMGTCFDEALTRTSLRYYDLAALPAIRGPLPAGVSNVLFRVDLAGLAEIALRAMPRARAFWRVLPPPGND